MIKFGTDGWRAIIAEDFTFANVKVVSQAIADYLRKKNKSRLTVVIGYDRRFLSAEFAQTVAQVLAANAIHVDVSDRDVPTPLVSFHCAHGNYDNDYRLSQSSPVQWIED